jgi:hypothetical protein
MRAKATTATLIGTAPSGPLAALMALSGIALWIAPMLRREALVAAYGPICSHGASPLLAHCPACYFAAGLVAGASALLIAGALGGAR